MPKITAASPQISVRLYKSISRSTIDDQTAASVRYQSKDEYIDLTPFLNAGSTVRTSKSIRDPAGCFSIVFADRPHNAFEGVPTLAWTEIESVYGLVEPMDVVEIRMHSGMGNWSRSAGGSPLYPIRMRGFITEIRRAQSIGQDGRPSRQVIVTGHDYGKIWQMYQVLHLPSYSQTSPLLTSQKFNELFGGPTVNTVEASEFVRIVIERVINPFIEKFMPEHTPMPRSIQTGDSLQVKHGVINNSYQNQDGSSVYDLMTFHGDVGTWNELYIEDRDDGVHCVYRPVPSLLLTRSENDADGLVQDDAVMPPVVTIDDSLIVSLTTARSDANVANFFWVNNARYDLISDQARKMAALSEGDSRVSLENYPNSAVKYYAVRPMYAETQQSGDGVTNAGSGLNEPQQSQRTGEQMSWIESRLRILRETNKDNVVYERGTAVVKGGLMRPNSTELLKAGDYVKFVIGKVEFMAYVVQLDDDFSPFQGYTTTITFERGEGFAERVKMEGGRMSPWLAEQATAR